jgi:hypothetical protein
MLPVFVSHEIPIKDYFYTWRIVLPVGFLRSNITHHPSTYMYCIWDGKKRATDMVADPDSHVPHYFGKPDFDPH